MRRGGIACAHTRLRAWKSRLLTMRDAAPLYAATSTTEVERVLAALGGDPFARLLRIYTIVLRAHDVPLVRALLGLHEIENVKLLWRVAALHRDVALLPRFWRDLGALATVSPPRDASSLRDVAGHLAKTPYATIARNVLQSPEGGELAFDRWASQRLLDAARTLPPREAIARRLAENIVRERDARIVRRGMPAAAVLSRDAVDVVALRRERLRLCRRAFTGDPFLLSPAVAIVLLAEEEVRAVRALVERGGDATLDAPLARAVAASQLGA